MIDRKKTRKVMVKDIFLGGDAPISIQSMTNTKTTDIEGTLGQIEALEKAGCDIVRCAVPDTRAAEALKEITKRSNLPVVADIHFDYKLAIKSMENGVAALRINPGNIGEPFKVQKVATLAKEKNIPIRIGVNSGSLEKEILNKYGGVTSEALVESALGHIKILEDMDFYDIVISIKSSDVNMMIDSYRLISKKCDYPLHIGVTEAGTPFRGTIKSSVGIGTLLALGIGDTVRVSLTGDPVEEIKVAKEILRSLGYLKGGIQFISCPTCGRTEIDLIKIATKVEEKLKHCNKSIKVAIMGCAVNGPGEAREADIGIAGGNGVGLIFKKGEILKKVKEEELIDELLKEIDKL